MPRTPEEQKQWEQQCYGCDIHKFMESVDNSITVKCNAGGYPMVIMSILSDAQELIEMGHKESARQHINRAKKVLSDKIDPKSWRNIPAQAGG